MNFPPDTNVDNFYISDTVVSAGAWERFLQEQPRWRTDNIEALIKEGLVKEDYLYVPLLPGAPAEGVPGISWYAATAFCEWLNRSLPFSFSGWELRLPREAEWEYAAKAGALEGTSRFWEWCEDPFVPLSFLSLPPAGLGSPERSLRGGSWVNAPGTVGNETRGSLPPSFCSPFVSFRPVIALKGDR
jgi:formylglycine-generating enzyme required for sulfatase activity